MTKEIDELVEKQREIAKSGDHEIAHCNADQALLNYIGDKEVSEAFNEIDKWYA